MALAILNLVYGDILLCMLRSKGSIGMRVVWYVFSALWFQCYRVMNKDEVDYMSDGSGRYMYMY